MSCEFSTAISGGSSAFSPSSKYLASITGGSRITIRRVDNLEIVHIFQCLDKIEHFDFSPDSEFIMCALYSRNAIQVFSLADKEFKCRINEGVAGMVCAWWCPDSCNVAVESDFGVQVAFWSLTDCTAAVIALPKPAALAPSRGVLPSQMLAYAETAQCVAVVHRIELHDHIAVYAHGGAGGGLTELAKFKARPGSDIAHIRWMPGDSHIVAVDSPLSYRLCVYTPAGENVAVFEAYQHALGIRSLALPVSQRRGGVSTASRALLAVGSFDGRVRVLSAYSWQLAFVLPLVHPKELDVALNGDGVTTTVEVLTAAGGGVEFADSMRAGTDFKSVFRASAAQEGGRGGAQREVTYVTRMVKALPRVTVDPRGAKQAAYPAAGVSWLAFNASGSLLAAREEAFPRCLWIWNPVQSKLVALLVQLESVTCAQWRPVSEGDEALPSVLAFCTGNGRVYFWNSATGTTWADAGGAEVSSSAAATSDGVAGYAAGCGISSVTSLQWNDRGDCLLLRGKEHHCTCTVNVEDFAVLQSTAEAVSARTGGESGAMPLHFQNQRSTAAEDIHAQLDPRLQDLDDDDNYL